MQVRCALSQRSQAAFDAAALCWPFVFTQVFSHACQVSLHCVAHEAPGASLGAGAVVELIELIEAAGGAPPSLPWSPYRMIAAVAVPGLYVVSGGLLGAGFSWRS